MSRRLLIIDTGSNALDFAMRAQEWGWSVLWYDRPRADGSIRMAGKGIVPKIVDYNLLRSKYLDWADLIFLPDNNFYLEMLEPYRLQGLPIFGPSVEAAQWELNREMGQKVMKKAGMKTIPGVTFHDYDDAARFVEKNPTYLVSKPSGDCDKAMSYVADDAASLVHMMLDRWKKNEKYRSDARKHGFILQEKVQGVEMAVGGWFGPGGWSKFWYENAEYKRLMNGDLGPNVGEQGTLSMYVRESKLADIALKPMTAQLKAMDYVGYVDNNGMILDDGSFAPFEFTMRPPWPGFHNLMATTEGDPAQWMLDLLHGEDTLQVKEDLACISIVVATPDYPYSHATQKELSGVPVYGASDREHVHLSEVMVGEEVPVQIGDKVVRMPHYVTCGDYVCVVCGTGSTITSARQSAYAAVKKVRIPNNSFYRTDIGRARLIEGLPKLHKHGFATGFTYG